MIETENVRDPRTAKLLEAERSTTERLDGLLAYVAMMADVELPEEGEEDE